MRVTDGKVQVNFACNKKLNKLLLQLKSGNIVLFDEVSWEVQVVDSKYVFHRISLLFY